MNGIHNNEVQQDRLPVIIITGYPGAGKTTLGKSLSERFGVPFVSKDEIKEILFDSLGWKDREWSMKLGATSYELMFYFAKKIVETNKPFILETYFSQISEKNHKSQNTIIHGLAKICAGTMFAYFFLKMLVFIHEQHWDLLNTPMGYWFMLEMLGFVLLPMILFFYSYRTNSISLVKAAAILTMLGVILNRLNVTVIGFRWDMAIRYVPSWMEFVVTMAVIFTEIWIFRWVINRMPVLRDSPSWATEKE